MPESYYEKIMSLFKEVIYDYKVSVVDLYEIIDRGDNTAKITKDWLYSLSKDSDSSPSDPGIKKMDALYRVLRKKKQQLQRAGNGK